MSFEQYEESEELGIATSLFYIKYGTEDANFWAFTDLDQPVTHDGVTYTPTTIGREKIENSGGLDNKVLNIDITPNSPLVLYYRDNRPTQVVTLTIRQGHPDDPDNDFRVVWTGRITGVQRKARFATISAEPIATSMRRPGLRRHYQYGCPWVLYSEQCGASEIAGRQIADATEAGKNFFEFATGWEGSRAKNKFRNGFVRWTNPNTGSLEVMSIIKVQQDTPVAGTDRIVVNGLTTAAVAGTQVQIYLGCNRRENDCADLHNNIRNFGGQPWIPKDNPVGFVNQYY